MMVWVVQEKSGNDALYHRMRGVQNYFSYGKPGEYQKQRDPQVTLEMTIAAKGTYAGRSPCLKACSEREGSLTFQKKKEKGK